MWNWEASYFLFLFLLFIYYINRGFSTDNHRSAVFTTNVWNLTKGLIIKFLSDTTNIIDILLLLQIKRRMIQDSNTTLSYPVSVNILLFFINLSVIIFWFWLKIYFSTSMRVFNPAIVFFVFVFFDLQLSQCYFTVKIVSFHLNLIL